VLDGAGMHFMVTFCAGVDKYYDLGIVRFVRVLLALSVRSSREIPIFLRAWIAAIFIGPEARTVHSVVFSIVLVVW
jgi:phage shock protein PspC (stress-responsive transcriptional regulator)